MKTIDKKVLLNRKSCCGAKPHCTNCPYFPRGSMGSTKIYCHRCGTVIKWTESGLCHDCNVGPQRAAPSSPERIAAQQKLVERLLNDNEADRGSTSSNSSE